MNFLFQDCEVLGLINSAKTGSGRGNKNILFIFVEEFTGLSMTTIAKFYVEFREKIIPATNL